MTTILQQPAWLNTHEYPFPPYYFEYEGVLQHYSDVGKGEVLLFVHGTPSWSFDFRNVIKEVSKTHRCIAIDHIGFGLSEKPKNYDYSTLQHAKRLSAFIQFLQVQNITLVLHDFGGPIGFRYALDHPETVSRFVILNSWLWNCEEDPTFKKLRRILKSPLLPVLYIYFNFSARFLLPQSFGDKKLSSSIHQQYTKAFKTRHERMGTLAFAKSLLHDQAWFEEMWSNIDPLRNKPVLFVWGMKDSFLKPEYLEKFTTAFVKSTVVPLNGCGHFPQEEEPLLVSTAIQEFMKST